MPIGDITLLDQIEAELVTAIEPMLVPFDEDGIRSLQIEPFNSAEDMALLLSNFRSKLPAAFLNVPTIDYNSDGQVRACDMVLNYGFLIGVENVRSTTDFKKRAAYYFHDAFHRQFFYRKINNCEIAANLDFIRPQRFEFAETDNMMATLATFSIGVRNWLVRDAER